VLVRCRVACRAITGITEGSPLAVSDSACRQLFLGECVRTARFHAHDSFFAKMRFQKAIIKDELREYLQYLGIYYGILGDNRQD